MGDKVIANAKQIRQNGTLVRHYHITIPVDRKIISLSVLFPTVRHFSFPIRNTHTNSGPQMAHSAFGSAGRGSLNWLFVDCEMELKKKDMKSSTSNRIGAFLETHSQMDENVYMRKCISRKD